MSEPRVGIEWADDLETEIAASLDKIECFELIPENFFDGKREKLLQTVAERNLPTLVHAVELSVGTDGPFRKEHFEKTLEVMKRVPVINLSDHLCMTEAGGIEIGQLTPIPWNARSVDVVCRNIDYIQSRIEVPFLIENITNRFLIPNQPLTETQFINQILEKTGCELLLDVTNVYTNATNFQFDPYEWIDEIRLDRVTGIHLAGGHYDDEGTLVDSHSYHVFDEVWDLYRYVVERCRPQDTIVEWTENTPEIGELLADMQKAKEILNETQSVSLKTEPQSQTVGGCAVSLSQMQEATAELIRLPELNRGSDFEPFLARFELEDFEKTELETLAKDPLVIKYGRTMAEVRWETIQKQTPFTKYYWRTQTAEFVWKRRFEPTAAKIRFRGLGAGFLNYVMDSEEAQGIFLQDGPPFIIDLFRFERAQAVVRLENIQKNFPPAEGSAFLHRAFHIDRYDYLISGFVKALSSKSETENARKAGPQPGKEILLVIPKQRSTDCRFFVVDEALESYLAALDEGNAIQAIRWTQSSSSLA